jgi:hypothetical protein
MDHLACCVTVQTAGGIKADYGNKSNSKEQASLFSLSVPPKGLLGQVSLGKEHED